jgi:hypothetical protein
VGASRRTDVLVVENVFKEAIRLLGHVDQVDLHEVNKPTRL